MIRHSDINIFNRKLLLAFFLLLIMLSIYFVILKDDEKFGVLNRSTPIIRVYNKTKNMLSNVTISGSFFHQDTKTTNTCTYPVPNIVHWVWFYPPEREMLFHQVTSALSAMYIQKPTRVYLWNTFPPSGHWWHFLKRVSKHVNIPIISKTMKAPSNIGGRNIHAAEHKSDVARLCIAHDYGGIYMDLDVIVLKPFTPFMCNELTLGQETEVKLNNGLIIAAPGARFLNLWLDYYHYELRDYVWDYNSVKTPFTLWTLHRHLVHVETRSFHHPNWRYDEVSHIFQSGQLYNWTDNYCLHTWYRSYKQNHNPEDIKTLNSTLGEIFRFIWFESSQLIPS